MELLGQAHRNDDALGFCFVVVLVAMVVSISLLVVLGQRASWRQTLSRVAAHLYGRWNGEIRLSGDQSGEPLRKGQTALIPACLTESLDVDSETVLLDAYLP
ncbi:MAG TPA: hypothetical protein VMP01_29385 [Pirellulaceae bacterium]|nr:hypothetical protein [Pirellulaceae bacterium]